MSLLVPPWSYQREESYRLVLHTEVRHMKESMRRSQTYKALGFGF